MAIEIVDLPSYKIVIFHSYVNVYQRVVRYTVSTINIHEPKNAWSYVHQLRQVEGTTL